MNKIKNNKDKFFNEPKWLALDLVFLFGIVYVKRNRAFLILIIKKKKNTDNKLIVQILISNLMVVVKFCSFYFV